MTLWHIKGMTPWNIWRLCYCRHTHITHPHTHTHMHACTLTPIHPLTYPHIHTHTYTHDEEVNSHNPQQQSPGVPSHPRHFPPSPWWWQCCFACPGESGYPHGTFPSPWRWPCPSPQSVGCAHDGQFRLLHSLALPAANRKGIVCF